MWIHQDFNASAESVSDVQDRNSTRVAVAIIGGGIGGAALALALGQRGIPYKIFEKDENMNTRRQGYALTLQQGGSALRALGLGKAELMKHGYIYHYNICTY